MGEPFSHLKRPAGLELTLHRLKLCLVTAQSLQVRGTSRLLMQEPLNPDPRKDPKSRSLNGVSYKVPLVVKGPKLGDLLSRSSRRSGLGLRVLDCRDQV